ncbi:L-threonylcarbamoyladenylate synthase [Enterobacter cloacae]|nr:Sua5/YciO/YrdC/YwlC family protein [Enterobacter cloacae]EKV5785760.1 Sua5/YciO/YrdC/YwlC family protein [Enterobacter cloacae]
MSFIDKAITVLRNSGIILIPTDTHFALAADPYSPDAVEKLTLLKRSPCTREMTFCFCELADIWEWVDVSPWQRSKIEMLSRACWPGTFKISLRKKQRADFLPGAGDILPVVCVKNSQMRTIISRLGRPLVVIPAGYPQDEGDLVSFTLAREDMGDCVDLVVPSNCKNPSRTATTHISLLDDKVSILRHGELDISSLL